MGTSVWIAGQLSRWPSKFEMAKLLRDAGLTVRVGQFSITINDCEHFSFEHYAGDFDPCIEANAGTIDQMRHDAQLVSRALAMAGIGHNFEMYDETDAMVDLLQHDWPPPPPSR